MESYWIKQTVEIDGQAFPGYIPVNAGAIFYSVATSDDNRVFCDEHLIAVLNNQDQCEELIEKTIKQAEGKIIDLTKYVINY
jgi:hypothetical protein